MCTSSQCLTSAALVLAVVALFGCGNSTDRQPPLSQAPHERSDGWTFGPQVFSIHGHRVTLPAGEALGPTYRTDDGVEAARLATSAEAKRIGPVHRAADAVSKDVPTVQIRFGGGLLHVGSGFECGEMGPTLAEDAQVCLTAAGPDGPSGFVDFATGEVGASEITSVDGSDPRETVNTLYRRVQRVLPELRGRRGTLGSVEQQTGRTVDDAPSSPSAYAADVSRL